MLPVSVVLARVKCQHYQPVVSSFISHSCVWRVFHNFAVWLIFIRSFLFILEADKSTPTNTAPVETGSMYEGVDSGMGKGSVDGAHTPAKDRSESANLDHFMKKIKPENIEGIICEGIYGRVNQIFVN